MGTAIPTRNVFTTPTRRLLAALCCILGMIACGSGLDTEEARAYCDDVRASQQACVDDDAYQSCVACYEDCGVDCAQLESCPLQFSCE
jgi:hypothetical protein